jgi:hypothetical protein
MQRQLMMLIAVVPTYSGINGLKSNYSFELQLRHFTFLLNSMQYYFGYFLWEVNVHYLSCMTYSPRKQEGRKIPLVDYRMLDIEGKINQISENHLVIQKIKLSKF